MIDFYHWISEGFADTIPDKKLAKLAKKCTPQAMAKFANRMGCYVEPGSNHDIVRRVSDNIKIDIIGRHTPIKYCDKITKNIAAFCPGTGLPPQAVWNTARL